jgi:uncharacterized protein with FMN-binding domain
MRRVIAAAVGTVAGLIMLLSFKTHALPTTLASPPAVGRGPSPGTTPATTSAADGTDTSTSGSATTSTTTGTVTVTGSAASTRYGPVQVQVTVTNGQITSVDAVEYPTQSGRDRQINARAVPELNQEAVTAQSAKIDMVSGATYTSTGYITSLQSALNKAGLG